MSSTPLDSANTPAAAPANPPGSGVRRRAAWVPFACGCVLLLVFHLILGRFFPNGEGRLGHDYSYFLPSILAGDYWFARNGLFAVPWFTPAFCGGVPLFGDPQSVYYSVGQWLSFLLDPVHAVYASVLIFAALGYWGTYRLARDVFGTGQGPATLAAALFLFNGFYMHRMLVGHYAFHGFMLVPFIAWALCRGTPPATVEAGARARRVALVREAGWTALATLGLAYLLLSGIGAVALAVWLAVAVLVLLHVVQRGTDARPGRLLARCVLAFMMCALVDAARIQAALSFLAAFPHDDYPLPAYQSLADAVWVGLRMVFLADPDIAAYSGERMVNARFFLDRHELDYSVGPVAAVAMVTGAVLWLRAWRPAPPAAPGRSRVRQWALLLLAVSLLVPVAMNTWDPDWNHVLKMLPLVRNSSNLVRWYLVWIPPAAILSALALENWPERWRLQGATAATVAVALLSLTTDRESFSHEPYPIANIRAAYNQWWRHGHIPDISKAAVYRDAQGAMLVPVFRNDALTQGASQIACYQPLFGYSLEHFPMGKLHSGSVLDADDDGFNLKNPACYQFPAENACRPGDHFRIRQLPELMSFAAYGPMQFEMSLAQRVANQVTLLALVLLQLALLAWLAVSLQARRAGRLRVAPIHAHVTLA